MEELKINQQVNFLKSNTSEIDNLRAISYLMNLSVESKNKEYMGSKELGLVPLLLTVVLNDPSEATVKAWEILSNLSVESKNREYMGSNELGLVPSLMAVVSNDQSEARVKALECLWDLAIESKNKEYMGSKEVGLVPLLMTVVSNDQSEARAKALGCLFSLAVESKSAEYMGSKEVGLVPLLMTIVSNDQSETRVKALGCLWNLMILYSNIPYFVECNGITIVMNVFTKTEKDSESYKKSLTMLMVSCRHPMAAAACKQCNGIEVFTPLVSDTDIVGLKSAFIISFISGRDEIRVNQKSLLQTHLGIVDMLLSVLTNTVNGLEGNGYAFGNFDLNVIVAAVLSLSISDSNKQILVSKPFLPPLFSILLMFVNNDPMIPYRGVKRGTFVGGGGNDVESAETVVEILLQFSFYYESDIELQITFLVPELKAKEILTLLLTNDKLSNDCKRSVSTLSNRLEDKNTPVGSAVEFVKSLSPRSSSVGSKKHCMISYSWAIGKDRVIALCDTLVSMGIDVWRDEVGSSILSEMTGATDERMAEAIELSHTVVVFVSISYKCSANCRQEGKYANSMFKRNKLKIIYVMMDNNYTTVSSPDCVDGWLGIMIGDALWYPLWEQNHIESTAKEIVKLINSSQPLQQNSLIYSKNPTDNSQVKPTPQKPISSPTLSPSPIINNPLEEAWQILLEPLRAIDFDKLTAVVTEIGLLKSSDLIDCDEEMIDSITKYLKPLPKKTFMKNIDKAKNI